MPPAAKAQYRNKTDRNVGAVRIDKDGDEKGVAVRPGETVWLTEDERRSTARAPHDPNDNPFVNGTFEKITDERVIDTDERPIEAPEAEPQEAPEPPSEPQVPAGDVQSLPTPPTPPQAPPKAPQAAPAAVAEETAARGPSDEETGAAVPPQGKPPEGEYGEREEVGTPDAARQGVPSRPQGTEAIKTPAPRPAAGTPGAKPTTPAGK